MKRQPVVPGEVIRSVTDVGPGDWVKAAGRWRMILTNTAFGADPVPREWVITTIDGARLSMWDIDRYAKDGDPL